MTAARQSAAENSGCGLRLHRLGARVILATMKLPNSSNVKLCKWYVTCPIRRYTEQGKLEPYWVEHFCLVSNEDCIRFQMEEAGRPHPDNMLPNGEIRADLD